MNLHFSILGPVRGWRGDTELDLGSPQQRAVLAVLAIRGGRSATVAELVDAVWGADPPPRAVGALRTYVSRLRGVLEADRSAPRILVSAGDGYALRVSADALDLRMFDERIAEAEAARSRGEPDVAAALFTAALALWSGAPLAGLAGPYVETQRAWLTERKLAAAQAAAETAIDLGRHAAAVGELTALVGENPLREGLRGLLMLALYRSGRQAEALGLFADTRRVLAEELGIDPGPELRDLHQRILEADPGLAAPPIRGAVQDVRVISRPAQLPADLADFTGRDDVVADLAEVLTGAGSAPAVAAVAAVAGIGGVGKTALAVHVAHIVKGEFPGGQLYMDLLGVGGHHADPDVVLAGFLRALGVADGAIPEGTAERAALYRSRLAGRRLLILLDNASGAEQVKPLLPGSPGCAVIVTGRAAFGGLPGAKLLTVDIMASDEAFALVARIVGEDRARAAGPAVRELVELCGQLPLAVRIVASRLAARPKWTAEHMVRRLGDERRRLAELRVGNLAVAASFQLGYDQLDTSQAAAFRLLAEHDMPVIGLPVVAAALETDEAGAEEIMESLVDTGFIYSPAVGRYRYHHLLWLFARQCSDQVDSAADRRAVVARTLDFLRATQRNVHRLVRPGDALGRALGADVAGGLTFGSAADGRAWTFQEMSGILGVARQVTDDPSGSLAAVADLLIGLDPLIEDGFNWQELEPLARAVLVQARRRQDTRTQARARFELGRVLMHTSRLEEALVQAAAAEAASRDAGDSPLLAEVLSLLAHIAFYDRRHADALAYTQEALIFDREHENRIGEAERLVNAAYLHVASGEPESAAEPVAQSLALFAAIGYPPGIAYAHYTHGVVLMALDRVDEAVARYADCIEVCEANGLRARQAYALFRMAEAELAAERWPRAVASAEQALSISQEIGEEYNQGRALTVLGRGLVALGQDDRGHGCWRESLEIFTRLRVPDADDVAELLAEAP